MRFISPNPGYRFHAIPDDVEEMANGRLRVLKRGFICEFKPGDFTTWEAELARSTFKFRGVPHDESGVRDIDPVPARVSSFDTSTVPENVRSKVEAALLGAQRPDDHILAVKPATPAPWPAYDGLVAKGKRTIEMVAAKIAETVTEQGYNPEAVIAYERTNLARPEVLTALEELAKEPEEELVTA